MELVCIHVLNVTGSIQIYQAYPDILRVHMREEGILALYAIKRFHLREALSDTTIYTKEYAFLVTNA